MSFAGLRVIALESRRAKEIAVLIRNQGGEPVVAPSVREIAVEDNHSAFDFAGRLFAGGFDMMLFMTGVGAKALDKVLASRFPEERFRQALRGMTVGVRGPKPAAVMREWNVPMAFIAPEPNTWRELLAASQGRAERRIALQEYGQSNTALIDALRARGAEVTPVQVYLWDLPEDTAPLREAARQIARGEADVILFTTQVQWQHLLRIADEEGIAAGVRESLGRMVVASIGPTTTEALAEAGIRVDFEPSKPKMGILVQELAAELARLIDRRRRD